ncbi:MAG: FAD-linked oxidase C-terminal domain-containing protein [Dinoroseobacter sp.]|nr:FAD-linked oxidase C-terminal domain-containing protein [Dinoroseobacter sp.]
MALVGTLPRNEDGIASTVGILKQRFGDRLQTGAAIRAQHAHTTTWLPNQPADAVVFASSTEEVSEIVRICADHRTPLIPFGTGTSLEGHLNAPGGGISLDLSHMQKVLEVHAEDLDCRIQPGVTRKQLNTHLRDQGLFFPIDPGADASLGGMAATRASGTNAVRYGTMRDNVIALEAVMADGRAVRTARRARKTSAGYDLTRLLIGSEGTLGIITELTLKLQGIPEAMSSARCSFPSVEAACNAVILSVQMGLPMARIELLDGLQVKACNAYSKLSLPEGPLLLLEFHGSKASVAEQAQTFGEIADDTGGFDFAWSGRAEDRTALWQARHDAYWASIALRPGCKALSTDICVPISQLAACVTAAQMQLEKLDLMAPIVGHAGDGNFHCLLLLDEHNPDDLIKAEHFTHWLADLAHAHDGTCTGEHGIGQGKASYLRAEIGESTDVMAAIKTALDPDNILNPGKILLS